MTKPVDGVLHNSENIMCRYCMVKYKYVPNNEKETTSAIIPEFDSIPYYYCTLQGENQGKYDDFCSLKNYHLCSLPRVKIEGI